MSRTILLPAALLLLASAAFPQDRPEPADLAARDPYGLLAWRFVTGGQIRAAAAVGHDGVLYAVSDERRLYAVFPSGRRRWSRRLEARPAAAPLLGYDGSVYVGLEGGRLLALTAGGRLRWRAELPAELAAGPASAADGTLYLPLRGGLLLALDPSGRERWRFQMRGEVSGGPSVGADGTVYLGAADRRLLALGPDGAARWEVALPGAPGAAAVGGDGTIYVAAFGLHAVSPEGKRLWSYAIPEAVSDPVIGPGGTVVAGTLSGRLLALDPAGRRLWERSLGAPILQPAAFTPDGAILAACADTLFSLTASGEVRWSVQAKRPIGPPVPVAADCAAVAADCASRPRAASSPAAEVVFGSQDWILYGLRVPREEASRPQEAPGEAARPAEGAAGPAPPPASAAACPWPVAFHDGHHTGRAGALQDLEGADFLALQELARYPSEEAKLRSLRELGRYFGGDQTGRLHVSILERLAGGLLAEGVDRLELERARRINDFPAVRRQACRLLAEAGTAGATELLAGTLRRDPDRTVRSAAAQALGRIGADTPQGLAPLLLAELETHPREESYGLALLEALAAILPENPQALDLAGLRALLRLSRESPSREIRRAAADLLRGFPRLPAPSSAPAAIPPAGSPAPSSAPAPGP